MVLRKSGRVDSRRFLRILNYSNVVEDFFVFGMATELEFYRFRWRGFISLWSLTFGCNPCYDKMARISNPR